MGSGTVYYGSKFWQALDKPPAPWRDNGWWIAAVLIVVCVVIRCCSRVTHP